MRENCGDRPLLGSVLVAQGVVESGELNEALLNQAESGKQLGEILVDRGLICRPELDRASRDNLRSTSTRKQASEAACERRSSGGIAGDATSGSRAEPR
jgi:hypothetical protein